MTKNRGVNKPLEPLEPWFLEKMYRNRKNTSLISGT